MDDPDRHRLRRPFPEEVASALLLLLLLASAAEAKFYAAAGKADITPDPERETVWLAGYGASGRRAAGVLDPLHARAVVLSDGKKTVAIAAVDSIGVYIEDVRDIRRRLGWADKEDRYLLLSATHDHSAPDTLGLWGRFPGVSGVDARYHERLKQAVVGLVRSLEGRLQEAELRASSSKLDPRGLCRDSRDPVVIDPELNVLTLAAKDGKTIGTVVRWSCHPEAMGEENDKVTADFPGVLCAKIEEKTGGACLFLTGAVGGLMSPDVEHVDGVEAQHAFMKELGLKVALAALSAAETGKDRYREPAVSFEARTVRLPVENSRYILFLRSLAFGHRLLDADGRELPRWKTYWYPLRHLIFFPLPEELRPWVETEVSLVRVGPVRILGVPGELFPELALGGYDGSYAFGHPVVRPTNPNPPDLDRAPGPPYLRERLGAEHGLIVGLANDEVGYIVPGYDFQAAPTRSMTPKPAGTHYEETNSVGKRASARLVEALQGLVSDGVRPDGRSRKKK